MIKGIENAYPNYGVSQQKKFPLPDKKHVLSAIRFFNYVEPKYEKQLAAAIMRKIDEYGMDDINVGPDNRFLKYWTKRNDQLAHHGILGMKWGIRRYQNEDGTLTAEGRERYGVDAEPKYNDDPDSRVNVNDYVSKKERENANVLQKVGKEKSKSNRRQQLEQRYRELGMSAEEASVAAYKREKTEKILMAVGVAAVAGVAIYAGKKWCDANVDKMIRQGETLQRIDRFGDNGVKDAFYAAYGKHDKNRYEGLLGAKNNLFSAAGLPDPKKVTMTVGDSGIKVASPKSFQKAIESLAKKDTSFVKDLSGNIDAATKSGGTVRNKT